MRNKDNMSPDEAFVLTLYGEARNQGENGIRAVGHVILNRLAKQKKHYGLNLKEVCLKPWQFSCWNAGDPNLKILLNIPWESAELSACKRIGLNMLEDKGKDITAGALHYCTRSRAKTWVYAQGKEPCAIIGDHFFYNNIDN